MNDFWLGVAYSIVLLSVMLVAFSIYGAMQTFRWFVREYAERTSVMALSGGLEEVRTKFP